MAITKDIYTPSDTVKNQSCIYIITTNEYHEIQIQIRIISSIRRGQEEDEMAKRNNHEAQTKIF